MYSPNVFMIGSGYGGCNKVRINLPAEHNGFRMAQPSLSGDRRPTNEIRDELAAADVVVFHRAEEQTYHDLSKMLKKDGKKIVMDNDDTFVLEDNHPLAQFNADGTVQDNLKRRSDNIDEFMRMCDMVTTTTKTLAEEYKKHNKNVVILPNCIDPDDWDTPLRNDGDKVRIGIFGSAALEYDYLHLKDYIRELSERPDITICMMGLGDKEHRRKNPKVTQVFHEEYAFWDSIKIEHTAWMPVHLMPQALNEMRLDIMLIPRKDNYFNRCKSNLKFLESAMCEVPVVAQSFTDGPYEEIEDWVTGVLIKDNSEWKEKVEKLIKNKELRRQIGKNAREYVIKNYDIADHAYKWDEAYKSLFK
jgi:glycosyltransferase involved in cell wall biosynthesis